MDLLVYWLPIFGGILLGGFAVGAWYGGHRVAAICLGFSGLVCFLLLFALQVQQNVLKAQNPPPTVVNADEPIVSIDDFAIEARLNSEGKPGKLAFRPIMKNSGRTPALNLKASFNLRGRTTPIPEHFDYPDINADRTSNISTLAPGQHRESATFWISASYAKRVWQKQVYLFLYGWIEYDDKFAGTKRHRTEFCWRIELAGDPTLKSGTLLFSQYGPYNCIDKGCLYQPGHHPPKISQRRNHPSVPAE